MITNNIKFTHANFEYYVLHIKPATDLSQVKVKLTGFKQRINSKENIVLSFEPQIDLESMTKYISSISEITGELGLILHSIQWNKTINVDSILGYPVITLPNPKKNTEQQYAKTLTIDTSVRSGMIINHDGDIIVTNFVSNGSELIATGNIHVYGELRGRAVAGNGGDKTAKIFATKFNPELISIGGIYRAVDTKLPDNLLNKIVIVSLDDKQRLSIAAIE